MSAKKTDALEPFHPDRIASRILGMGDVLSLIEDLQRSVDHEKAEKMAAKFKKGDEFTLDDFREQLVEMKKMGGMMSMLDKLPSAKNLPDHVKKSDGRQNVRENGSDHQLNDLKRARQSRHH